MPQAECEFCKDINCHKLQDECLVKLIDCDNFDHGCPHSAYSFFYWMRKNNYKIIKEEIVENAK